MTGNRRPGELIMYGAPDPNPERRTTEVDPIPIRPLFLAVYGAGEFMLAAHDETEAARRAHRLRRHIELALPLVTPLSDDEAAKYREENLLSSRFEQRILANPKADEMQPAGDQVTQPEVEAQQADFDHPSLFELPGHEELAS